MAKKATRPSVKKSTMPSARAFSTVLKNDKELKFAQGKLDVGPVRAAGIALADALNAYRALALEEQALLKTKRALRGLRPLGEGQYTAALNRFRDKLPATVEAVRSGLDQFENSGLNLVLSRHVQALVVNGKLYPSRAWAECKPLLGDRRLSVLTELFGLNTEIIDHVWGDAVNLPTELAVKIFDPEELENIAPGLGAGLSNLELGGGGFGDGGGIHVPVHKGVDLLIQDFMYLWQVSTEEYARYVAENGVPVSGKMFTLSPSHLAAGSPAVWLAVGILCFIAGALLGFSGPLGALLWFGGWLLTVPAAFGLWLELTADDPEFGEPGASGFVDP